MDISKKQKEIVFRNWQAAANALDAAKAELAQAQSEDVSINELKGKLVQTKDGQGAAIALNQRKIAVAYETIREYEANIAVAQQHIDAAAQQITEAEQARASRIAAAQEAVKQATAAEKEAVAAMSAAVSA